MSFKKSLLLAFLMSMVPLLELRAAVFLPWERMYSIFCETAENPTIGNILFTYFITVAGNLIPVPFILLFIPKILAFLERFRLFRPFVGWLRRKADKHSEKVTRGAFIGLFTFVFLPIPGTGAWTGSLVASLFGMPKKRSFFIIALGVLCCGVLMNLFCYLFFFQGVKWVSFFIGK